MSPEQSELRITPAVASDEAAWRRMWEDFIALDTEKCPASATDFIWRSVLDPDAPMHLFFAFEGEQPLGFLLYTTHVFSRSVRPVCYLLDVYVEPQWRGRGIGRHLIEYLRDLGRASGWFKISWMTQADNAAARRLYDKLGTASPLVRYDMPLNGYDA